MPLRTTQRKARRITLLVGRHPGDEAHAGRDEAERRVRHRGAARAGTAPTGPRWWKRTETAMCVLELKSRGVEADPVHRRRDREHVRRGQAGRAPQALIAVARRRVDDVDERGSPVAAFLPVGRRRRPTTRRCDGRRVRTASVSTRSSSSSGLVDQSEDLADVVLAQRHQGCFGRSGAAPNVLITSDMRRAGQLRADPAAPSPDGPAGRRARPAAAAPRDRPLDVLVRAEVALDRAGAISTSAASCSSSRQATRRAAPAGTSTRTVPRPGGVGHVLDLLRADRARARPLR
mgnify:CR=1 FL=1